MRITIAMMGLTLAVLPAAAQPAPTATEIFELRTKCQAMATEVAKPFLRDQQGDQSAGVTMKTPGGASYFYTQQSKEREKKNQKFSVTAESNLDLKTLHCYALITLDEINPSNYQSSEKYIHLFDAQTEQTMAYIFDSQETKDTIIGAYISDKFFEKPPIFNSFELKDNKRKTREVMKYINDKMNPKR